MLKDDHIFSIKTKDDANVSDVSRGGRGIAITGLNVLRDQIQVGDFTFVVFGGDNPKDWTPGLVALAHISRAPYVDASDKGKNFRVEIDVDLFFQPSIKRRDLVSYPDTFGIIGIGPITKWEPNQAITAVKKESAIGLIQAICDLMPEQIERIRIILGEDFKLVNQPVRRYVESKSRLGKPGDYFSNLGSPIHSLLDLSLRLFQQNRDSEKVSSWKSLDEWADAARAEFAAVDAAKLTAPGFDYPEFARKFVYHPSVANKFFAGHSTSEKIEVGNFLSRERNAPRAASWYIDALHAPKALGVGPGVMLNFMMKLHPSEFCTYSTMIDEMLVFVGLLDSCLPKTVTVESYERSKSLQGQVLAKMHELGIGKSASDNSPADYLTVNEFAWWLSESNHKDLIKEKAMATKMKNADRAKAAKAPKVKKPEVHMDKDEEVVLLRLAAALRAKPFAILAGHSGTGKSRMVRKLAYMTCAKGNFKALLEDANGNPLKTPGNFCMVQVKPNWHDSTDLLGYYSELKGGFKGTEFVKFICKAYAYPEVPFFVCLDEMNLAPVEQYFAEYLSAIESRKLSGDPESEGKGTELTTDRLLSDDVWKDKSGLPDYEGLGCEFVESRKWLEKYGLTIPRNLFVVGTVNMDETTNQFSRKVLDRAFTLEMTDADFEHFGDVDPEPSFNDFAGDAFADALLNGKVIATKPNDGTPEADAFKKRIEMLNGLKRVLANTSFVVAYRFANEYMLYADSLEKMKSIFTVTPCAEKATAAKAPAEGSAEGAAPANTAAPAPTGPEAEAFDDAVLMKVLPRITGDEELVMKIFVGKTPEGRESVKLGDPDAMGLVKLLGRESSCYKKMSEIVERGESGGSGTLTFWP